MATAKQRAWRRKFAAMYGGKKKRRKARRSYSRSVKRKTTRRRVYTMARRRRYGRRRRSSGSRLLSIKNLAATAIGAMVYGPVGAAAGAYTVGKSGVMGAAVGYMFGSQLASMASGLLGNFNLGGGSGNLNW